jgi:glucose-1-phosphate thymidylyltransferase
MRGVVLAGGLGTRLGTLTQVTNKHLLPVFDKPMIFYPIQTLVEAGITEVLVIVSGPHSGHFLPILKNGKELGLSHLEYAVQTKADGGIADALLLAEDFAGDDDIAVILGDNTMDAGSSIKNELRKWSRDISKEAHVFLKQVADPTQFGVACFNDDCDLVGIEEKPAKAPSSFAVIGLYLYCSNVFEAIRQCQPSERGQLEITDVNNIYIQKKSISYSVIDGFWQDAGTVENLFLANKYWAEKAK